MKRKCRQQLSTDKVIKRTDLQTESEFIHLHKKINVQIIEKYQTGKFQEKKANLYETNIIETVASAVQLE